MAKDLGRLDGRNRVVIEGVGPEIDGGVFAVKRVVGEGVIVEASVFGDGHDEIACRVLSRHERETTWHETPMRALGNDRWQGDFRVTEMGRYFYTIEGFVDRFGTWQHDLEKRVKAGQDVSVELMIGAQLVEDATKQATSKDAAALTQYAATLRKSNGLAAGQAAGLNADLGSLMARNPDRKFVTRYPKELPVSVDRLRARFSTWYELFPRSCSATEGKHGTFADVADELPRIAALGFDVVYLPPIHPIGITFRKGKNNSVSAEPGDVGSPWAIGAKEGGHKDIHPELGTMSDFRALVTTAKKHGLELALDIAFQCTPDHPYVKQHPEWFRKRPDGTIQYAENPPKKYQDIYPIDFESSDWKALWTELKSVFQFWAEEGVRIFRVDNPHTKAFPFWEWAIGELKQQYPDLIFLAEAFTRPHVMYRLAKLGFNQSYTYFTWRNTKQELTEYLEELTQTEAAEFFRPNFWPNTPDILAVALRTGGRGAFINRLVLAGTLTANYGIYGPSYELCENTPRDNVSEEYLNSEKYEIKHRDLDASWNIKESIAKVNRIRRENEALQTNSGLRFHPTDNPMLICYSKTTEDFSNIILTVVNLDPFHVQAGWVTLEMAHLNMTADSTYVAEDLYGGSSYTWRGGHNFVILTPLSNPAHIFRLRASA